MSRVDIRVVGFLSLNIGMTKPVCPDIVLELASNAARNVCLMKIADSSG